MRVSYDFARMEGRRNPFAGRLKRSVTIRLDDASIAYFKKTGCGDRSPLPEPD